VILRTENLAGPDRIELVVENHVLDGFKIQQLGILETVSPERTPSSMASVEPLGEFPIDMMHKAGDIKQFAVEALPVRPLPVTNPQPPKTTKALAGPLFEFVSSESSMLLEIQDTVIVVSHQSERRHAAAVQPEVELEEKKKPAGIGTLVERVIPGVTGRPVEKMIEGCLLALLSR
jgi:hypothetical protein